MSERVPRPLLLSKGWGLAPTTKEIPHPSEDGRMGHPLSDPLKSTTKSREKCGLEPVMSQGQGPCCDAL